MKIKKVLCPTDFSEYSDSALHYASTLAAEANALLIIVHVCETSPMHYAEGSSYGYVPEPADQREREERDQLSRVVPAVADVQYEHRLIRGFAEKEILALAERENVDLIVMGSHGRTGLYRMLMVSIAEGVLRRASCPVLIVRRPLAAENVPPSGETVSHDSP